MGNRELLHLISILLQYPESDWEEIDFENGIQDIAKSNLEIYQQLISFIQFVQQTPMDELKEYYVRTFDFNEKTNLYLSYSKMKEERERGVVLVELKQFYEQAGLFLESDELPDYLPLFLEFITMAKEQEIEKVLPPFLPAIQKLRDELILIQSPYASLVEASLTLLNEGGAIG